jgi:peptidyl-prolyl isomerase E (cyclophilin E)
MAAAAAGATVEADGGGRARRTLYVGGLDEGVTQATLQAAFIPFGELTDVQLPVDVATGKHRGFGFVEFADEGDAKDALDNMHNSELFGRVLRVNVARPAKSKSQAAWASADAWYQALREGADEEGGDAGDDGGAGADGRELDAAVSAAAAAAGAGAGGAGGGGRGSGAAGGDGH